MIYPLDSVTPFKQLGPDVYTIYRPPYWRTKENLQHGGSILSQQPITRSLHTNCTLESTLSRIFLILELRYLRELFDFQRKWSCFRRPPHSSLKEKWRLIGEANLYSFSDFPCYFDPFPNLTAEEHWVSANWKLTK